MKHEIMNYNFEGWVCSCGAEGYGNDDFEKHKMKRVYPIGPEEYQGAGLVIKREEGLTPNGNQIGNRWVLRDEAGEWIDCDQYRYDLMARNDISMTD
jgi:hypothetical protein